MITCSENFKLGHYHVLQSLERLEQLLTDCALIVGILRRRISEVDRLRPGVLTELAAAQELIQEVIPQLS
jgi:hypothetical protein